MTMPETDILLPCGKALATVEVMRLVLEHERIPFEIAVGPDGPVITVSVQHREKLRKAFRQWATAFIECVGIVGEATYYDPLSEMLRRVFEGERL